MRWVVRFSECYDLYVQVQITLARPDGNADIEDSKRRITPDAKAFAGQSLLNSGDLHLPIRTVKMLQPDG